MKSHVIVCIAALMLLLATTMTSQSTDAAAAAPLAAGSTPSTGRRIRAGVQSSAAFFHRHHSWKSMPAVQRDQIHRINHHMNTTWKAGVNPRFARASLMDAARLCGVSPTWMESYEANPTLPLAEEVLDYSESRVLCAAELPESYDVRDQWGDQCADLHDITDQGSCGSCWAVSAASTMTDRNCIASNGTWSRYMSSADILSCCGYQCGTCEGGEPDHAWNYYLKTGVVTGGHYGSGQGCMPYTIRPCQHGSGGTRPQCTGEGGPTPYCPRSCADGDVLAWNTDKRTGYSAYRVGAGRKVEAIMSEVLKRGSVQATFYVYSDFLNYRSGVYQRTTNEMIGGHAVKIVGWGVDEASGVPYWTAANSWNTDWGEMGGFFKIRRGTNECQFEDLLFAGIPNLPITPEPAPSSSSSTGSAPAPASSSSTGAAAQIDVDVAAELKAALKPVAGRIIDRAIDAAVDAAVALE